MLFKICIVVCCAYLLFGFKNIMSQEAENKAIQTRSNLGLFSRMAIEQLANLTDDFWLNGTYPSGGQLNGLEFSLFKLNTDQLASQHDTDIDNTGEISSKSEGELRINPTNNQTAPTYRRARKMGLFKNVLNKPKVSPLYLVNGTVCRFVNTQPICTTLSTTGLFRK